MRMKWWLAAFLLVLAGLSTASTREEMRKQAEGSMLLTGSIGIEPDGSVSGYAIDQREKVPPYVLANIERHVPGWRFQPVIVDGRAASVRTKMSLRMVARPAGGGDFHVFIASASFGGPSEGAEDDTDQIAIVQMKPPVFPPGAYEQGGKGDVYVVLRIGRDGNVADAVVEQVNLKVVGSRHQVERIRGALSDATLRAARKWTFRPPTTGSEAGADFWSVRVPVSYAFRGENVAYGAWESYVPGPRTRAPWVDPGLDGNDALVAGGIYPIGSGITLLTALERDAG